MASSNKVFVSPGVFTSEKDLTYVTKQVGVTTLGIVGETPKGPAFEPVFIKDYGEFKKFFGGQNTSTYKGSGYPKYESTYIAKSYLSQSNQLYVSRILGFSGYDAGKGYMIVAEADVDPTTSGTVDTSVSISAQCEFNSSGIVTGITSSTDGSTINAFIPSFDNSILTGLLSNVSASTHSNRNTITTTVKYKSGTGFTGITSASVAMSTEHPLAGVVGSITGTYSTFTATSYTSVEDKVLCMIRSSAEYDGFENLTFKVTDFTLGNTTAAKTDAKASFNISGSTTSTVTPTFDYKISLDKTKQNYIEKVIGRKATGDGPLYIEEFYPNMFEDNITAKKIYGLKVTAVTAATEFDNYKIKFQPAKTPWILSQVSGTKLKRLFKLWTIGDGDSANSDIKISIQNIKPDDREFDVVVRSFNDSDKTPSFLEKYTRCSMDPTSRNFVAKKIGTLDSNYALKSDYIMVELSTEADTSTSFPAGFEGVPVRDYPSGSIAPCLEYKTAYTTYENKRKAYLGLSTSIGYDADFFTYKGISDTDPGYWTATTKGYHLDIDATGCTIDNSEIKLAGGGYGSSPISFSAGASQFRTESGLVGGTYEKINARKFSLAPSGGFDGWDIYRTQRTNKDTYKINGTRGLSGTTAGGPFAAKTTTTLENGITSDYYAYFEGLRTFSNPEEVNINVFTTPGINVEDHASLIESSIEMVEQDRSDSLYIATTPDTDASGVVTSESTAVDLIDGAFDSNYSATYWPWIQMNDTENSVYIYLPPTLEVVRNIAITDNIAFPWFATAGMSRGVTRAIKARKKLTLDQRDTLYAGRINPMATFANEGVVIFGNKTLQIKESALDRVNVRRLLLQSRKLISAVAVRMLFEQNDDVVRQQFLSLVNPILDNIRKERGLTDFRVVLSDDPEEIDRNELNGQIFIKPTRSLEFIAIEFVITNTGASFDDV